jgi:hypothetical protein
LEEKTMRFLKLAALAGAIMAGGLGLSNGGVSASPLTSAAMPVARAEGSLVGKAADRGRAEYAQYRYRRGYYRGPYYRGVRVYRPYRRAYGVYRPYPRLVCRTRIRLVRTAYGALVRRPVRVCVRR